ncbi:hypothetical protein GGS20DRAFT_359874 [Poronia punctata]|nr:hypothetical protein GGS20DRAFT_359874 [Poronia punctata]
MPQAVENCLQGLEPTPENWDRMEKYWKARGDTRREFECKFAALRMASFGDLVAKMKSGEIIPAPPETSSSDTLSQGSEFTTPSYGSGSAHNGANAPVPNEQTQERQRKNASCPTTQAADTIVVAWPSHNNNGNQAVYTPLNESSASPAFVNGQPALAKVNNSKNEQSRPPSPTSTQNFQPTHQLQDSATLQYPATLEDSATLQDSDTLQDQQDFMQSRRSNSQPPNTSDGDIDMVTSFDEENTHATNTQEENRTVVSSDEESTKGSIYTDQSADTPSMNQDTVMTGTENEVSTIDVAIDDLANDQHNQPASSSNGVTNEAGDTITVRQDGQTPAGNNGSNVVVAQPKRKKRNNKKKKGAATPTASSSSTAGPSFNTRGAAAATAANAALIVVPRWNAAAFPGADPEFLVPLLVRGGRTVIELAGQGSTDPAGNELPPFMGHIKGTMQNVDVWCMQHPEDLEMQWTYLQQMVVTWHHNDCVQRRRREQGPIAALDMVEAACTIRSLNGEIPPVGFWVFWAVGMRRALLGQ